MTTHTKECLAQAAISVIENWRDEEGMSSSSFRYRVKLGSFLFETAHDYLAEGLKNCICPKEMQDTGLSAERALSAADNWVNQTDPGAPGWEEPKILRSSLVSGEYAIVARVPDCDIHKYHMSQEDVPAKYDGKTISGPWANMCESCFKKYGLGLGVGRGQRLYLDSEID